MNVNFLSCIIVQNILSEIIHLKKNTVNCAIFYLFRVISNFVGTKNSSFTEEQVACVLPYAFATVRSMSTFRNILSFVSTANVYANLVLHLISNISFEENITNVLLNDRRFSKFPSSGKLITRCLHIE